MAKIEELQEEIKGLRGILAQAGLLRTPVVPNEHAPDYIAHGSPKHAIFLGLVEVEDESNAKADGYTVYRSRTSGKLWRLEDEIGALRHYPGIDPNRAMLLVLQQKVNELESGAPKPPADAPPMFVGEEVSYA